MAYKTVVLDLFLGRGRRIELRRHLLLNALTGDWRKCGVVEIYLPVGCRSNADRVRSSVAR
eukprot:5614609-Pyramimonas_sp.AAC.1